MLINLYMKVLRWRWERLTRTTMRSGFAYLYMSHYLNEEWEKCIADPILRSKLGIEVRNNPNATCF